MTATETYSPTETSPDRPSTTESITYGATTQRRARLRKFLAYYRPYWGLLLADMACACVVAVITVALPLGARYITQQLDGANQAAALGRILGMAGVMVALVGAYALANMFVDIQGHMMGARMENDMRRELFDHYLGLSFRFYDEQRTGQLMTRLTNDTLALAELYHHGPEDIVVAALTVAGTFVVLLRVNAPMTLLVFLFIPLMAAYALYFYARMYRAARRSKDRVGDINGQVEDTLAGIRVVAAFTNEAIERRKFASENGRFLASRRAEYASGGYFSGGVIALTQLMTITVVVCGAVAILRGALHLADLVTYLLYIGILIDPIQKLVNFARLYQEGMTGFDRFMEALEAQPDIRDAPDAVELAPVQGEIAFRHVTFTYHPAQPAVLRDLSLVIRAGEYVALVGVSGVGKTTLCSLIPRLYDVSAGSVVIDGVDIRAVTLRSLRQQIGLVQQDVYLFAGTIADNIRYGKLGASMAEVIHAAKLAHAHDFIMALPQGYQTDIGQRGVKLSGGQKQRLSIARVFLKDPPIIIFDEATSALDNTSEKAAQAALEALTTHRTMIVIAHRLSTIRNAQRILVLTPEGIVEEGTHAELLARDGVYANLYTIQAKI